MPSLSKIGSAVLKMNAMKNMVIAAVARTQVRSSRCGAFDRSSSGFIIKKIMDDLCQDQAQILWITYANSVIAKYPHSSK